MYDIATKRLHAVENEVFEKTHGSCYVPINSTHFVQIGGYNSTDVLKSVYLFKICILQATKFYMNVDIRYIRDISLLHAELPDLKIPRKFHGCGKAIINGKLSVIVSGGIGISNKTLKSVEYLSLPEQITEWKELPALNLARSGFPSLGFIGEELFIVSGQCTESNHCLQAEKFDKLHKSWKYDKSVKLKNMRYCHSTFEVTREICNEQDPQYKLESHNMAEIAPICV